MKILLIIFSTIFLALFPRNIQSCTAFQLKSSDGAFIYCRSLEFSFPMNSDLLIVPRGTEFTGTALKDNEGLKWKAKFGFVGMNQSMAPTIVTDGMNEKGLIVGNLYLPGYAKYEPFDPKRKNKTIGAWELGNLLLATCETIEEAKEMLSKILVAEEPIPSMGTFIIPLHFYVSDRSGAAIVVEYVNGKQFIHDNPLRVLTNSPIFNWHLMNLNNYINLSPTDVLELTLNDWKIKKFGSGSGLLGLPGDYTPPSRFVRATFFTNWATVQKNASDTALLGFHILNTFDIFEGIVRKSVNEKKGFGGDNSTTMSRNSEITEWVVVHDQTNLLTYFRHYDSLQIQMIDLKKIDFTGSNMQKITLNRNFVAEDVTDKVQPLSMNLSE